MVYIIDFNDFDTLEIHPCAIADKDTNPHEEITTESQAQYYCVFGHLKSGGLQDITNVADKSQAEKVARGISWLFDHIADYD